MFVLYLTPVHEGVISKHACLAENDTEKISEKYMKKTAKAKGKQKGK